MNFSQTVTTGNIKCLIESGYGRGHAWYRSENPIFAFSGTTSFDGEKQSTGGPKISEFAEIFWQKTYAIWQKNSCDI